MRATSRLSTHRNVIRRLESHCLGRFSVIPTENNVQRTSILSLTNWYSEAEDLSAWGTQSSHPQPSHGLLASGPPISECVFSLTLFVRPPPFLYLLMIPGGFHHLLPGPVSIGELVVLRSRLTRKIQSRQAGKATLGLKNGR